MGVSFAVAIWFQTLHPLWFEPLESWEQLLIGVGLTTVAWLAATYLTRPTDEATLRSFYAKVRPCGPLWNAFLARCEAEGTPLERVEPGVFTRGLIATSLGCAMVYAALFGTGYALYGEVTAAAIAFTIALLCLIAVARLGLTASGSRPRP